MLTGSRLLPQSTAAWLGLLAGLAALVLAPQFAPVFYVELGTSALIAAMLALSMQLLVGATGLVSLGHGAFYGLAAYAVYLVSPENAAQPIWLTLPLAMLIAGLAALLVGLFSLRTSGFFFLMVTLAFGQMIFFIFHDTKLGGGTDGAYLGKPLITAFGATLELPRRQRPLGIYYVALIQLVLMYAGLALLLKTLFGRALEGIKVNEHRMKAIGFDTFKIKLIAFTLAGSLAGAAGHMWALHRGFVNPEIVGWHQSAEALLMILLGGLGSLHGPILGALALTGIREFAHLITERILLVEGFVILAAVILLPKGLSGIASLWQRDRGQGGGHG
jgi:branched-chain amino acid transport system permease protein